MAVWMVQVRPLAARLLEAAQAAERMSQQRPPAVQYTPGHGLTVAEEVRTCSQLSALSSQLSAAQLSAAQQGPLPRNSVGDHGTDIRHARVWGQVAGRQELLALIPLFPDAAKFLKTVWKEEPEPELEPNPQPEPEPEQEPEPELEPYPQPEPEPELEPNSQPEPEPEPEPEQPPPAADERPADTTSYVVRAQAGTTHWRQSLHGVVVELEHHLGEISGAGEGQARHAFEQMKVLSDIKMLLATTATPEEMHGVGQLIREVEADVMVMAITMQQQQQQQSAETASSSRVVASDESGEGGGLVGSPHPRQPLDHGGEVAPAPAPAAAGGIDTPTSVHLLDLVCPEGAAAGHHVLALNPLSGVTHTVVVPAGVVAGEEFSALVDEHPHPALPSSSEEEEEGGGEKEEEEEEEEEETVHPLVKWRHSLLTQLADIEDGLGAMSLGPHAQHAFEQLRLLGDVKLLLAGESSSDELTQIAAMLTAASADLRAMVSVSRFSVVCSPPDRPPRLRRLSGGGIPCTMLVTPGICGGATPEPGNGDGSSGGTTAAATGRADGSVALPRSS
jgi:hypothetical protein